MVNSKIEDSITSEITELLRNNLLFKSKNYYNYWIILLHKSTSMITYI